MSLHSLRCHAAAATLLCALSLGTAHADDCTDRIAWSADLVRGVAAPRERSTRCVTFAKRPKEFTVVTVKGQSDLTALGLEWSEGDGPWQPFKHAFTGEFAVAVSTASGTEIRVRWASAKDAKPFSLSRHEVQPGNVIGRAVDNALPQIIVVGGIEVVAKLLFGDKTKDSHPLRKPLQDITAQAILSLRAGQGSTFDMLTGFGVSTALDAILPSDAPAAMRIAVAALITSMIEEVTKAGAEPVDLQGIAVEVLAEIGELHPELRTAATTAARRGDFYGAVGAKSALAERLTEAETKRLGRPGRPTANAYGSAAWWALHSRDFQTAITVSERALSYAPDQLWLKTNLAHGLLFSGRVEEARTMYLRHIGERDGVLHGLSWEQAILQDFQDLKRAGIEHPEMASIAASLRAGH